jgi:Cys-tRNA(Pro)/Cys-tRNA(Cys) deacylase
MTIDVMGAPNDYEGKCRDYIRQNHVAAEQIGFAESVHTAADAIRLTGGAVVKTVVLAIGDGKRFIACLVRGEDKVDLARIRALVSTGAVRVATRDEVLAATGYPAGGVPPFGHGLETFVDEAVVRLDIVVAGGGSDKVLVKTTAKELVRVTKARLAKLAQ